MEPSFKPPPEQLLPESDWSPPTELPDLSRETEVALDTETRDPLLAKDMGPGFYMYERTNPNTGYICGISAAWRDQKIYIPLRHPATQCFDIETVRRWLISLASQDSTRFTFHNFQYDWGWIGTVFNIPPPLLLDDTVAMASMINENLSSFSLQNLCKWQGIPGKDEEMLFAAMRATKVPKGKEKENLYKLPGKFVAPYAEQDAASTLHLAQKLRPLLAAECLEKAYQVERDLMPITLKMKWRGIRVDIDRTTLLARRIFEQCDHEIQELNTKLWEEGFKGGAEISDLRRGAWLNRMFEELDISPRPSKTPKTIHDKYGTPSFEKEFMSTHKHPLPRMCQRIKSRYDLADKFLTKFILAYNHKGRVYPSVNQFRSEEGGARSHRFSYSDPPLQQMPSRDNEYASLIRSCFIPEDGEEWCSIDYQQQEYRLIVYHAELRECTGAKRAADLYRTNPDTDFHDYVAKITRLPRKRAKDVNFATSYGAGVSKFSRMTGMDEQEAKKVMELYYKELPFVREVSNWYRDFAAKEGYIEMLDGARNHFNLWEPVYRDFAKEESYKKKNPELNTFPCSDKEMIRRKEDKDHPWYRERMKRSYTHKAFNRIIQGSAARQIKQAMVDVYNAGYMPILQIHDELAFSMSDPSHAKICAEMMEHAIPSITIPMLTDIKLGKSWGELKK
jgi:DNA polymerase I-like protein with 3'-5' exonuclease and polymerase domains